MKAAFISLLLTLTLAQPSSSSTPFSSSSPETQETTSQFEWDHVALNASFLDAGNWTGPNATRNDFAVNYSNAATFEDTGKKSLSFDGYGLWSDGELF